jgi:hypothetical protein
LPAVQVNTPQFRMADRMAGGKLAEIILDERDRFSAEEISRHLFAAHGIEVTGQTVRRWLVLLAPAPEGEAAGASS